MSLPKTAIGDMVGKTIEAVVVRVNEQDPRPRHQVFLVFTDGTHYELYGDDINCSGSLYPKGGLQAVLRYIDRFPGGKIICYTGQIEEEKIQ